MNRLPEDYQLSNRELRILLALAAGPSSGYGVAEQYREDAHDELKLSNGTLFPALKRLEDMGLITAESAAGRGVGRKMYQLTRRGRMQLTLDLAALEHLARLGRERL